MSAPSYWWDDHDNIVLTAYWMVERDHTARDLAILIEKPWKFTDEYEQARADWEAEEAAAHGIGDVMPWEGMACMVIIVIAFVAVVRR